MLCYALARTQVRAFGKLLVEAAGVELNNVFCLCNLQIIKDRQNPKIDDSQGHRTVIVQSHARSQAKPQAPTSDITWMP